MVAMPVHLHSTLLERREHPCVLADIVVVAVYDFLDPFLALFVLVLGHPRLGVSMIAVAVEVTLEG